METVRKGIASQRAAQPTQLLFIDDEEPVLKSVQANLRSFGYDVTTTTSWEEARSLVKGSKIQPQVVFVEPYSMDGKAKCSLSEVCAELRQIPVVVFSAARDPETITQAIRNGARHYLCKPLEPARLTQMVAEILQFAAETETGVKNKMNGDNAGPSAEAGSRVVKNGKVDLVFCGPLMQRIYDTVIQVADAKIPVLIRGESGVGKDLVARLIHEKSALRDRPFVKVNCAALPLELVESELFGYCKGAFTGAHTDRSGKFEFANGGTIFLDEIGEFPLSVQAKLLQVLQDGAFTRLGSNRQTDVDVRVMVATNRNLEKAILDGRFREDLYYRLNVINLEVPPLRRRREEIAPLCEHFLRKFGGQYGNDEHVTLPEKLVEVFNSYHWPGNIRELENLIKRYVVLQDAESIRIELEAKMTRGQLDTISEVAETYLQESMDNLDLKEISKKAAALAEKNMISRTLRKLNWNKWKTAKELRISYKTLLRRIAAYDIKPSQG